MKARARRRVVACRRDNGRRSRRGRNAGRRFRGGTVVALQLLALSACGGSRGPIPPPALPEPPPTCDQPLLDQVEGSFELVTQDDIGISAVPIVHACEPMVRVIHQRLPMSTSERLLAPVGEVKVRRVEDDVLARVENPRIDVEFTIVNRSDQVFRMREALWNVAVDGNPRSERGRGNPDAFITLTILPGQSRSVTVTRIPLGGSGEGSVFDFHLSEVVTERDVQGRPTRRASFEWSYVLTHQALEADVNRKTCELYGTPVVYTRPRSQLSYRCGAR